MFKVLLLVILYFCMEGVIPHSRLGPYVCDTHAYLLTRSACQWFRCRVQLSWNKSTFVPVQGNCTMPTFRNAFSEDAVDIYRIWKHLCTCCHFLWREVFVIPSCGSHRSNVQMRHATVSSLQSMVFQIHEEWTVIFRKLNFASSCGERGVITPRLQLPRA